MTTKLAISYLIVNFVKEPSLPVFGHLDDEFASMTAGTSAATGSVPHADARQHLSEGSWRGRRRRGGGV